MLELPSFSDNESKQIVISWGVLSLAFAIAHSGGISGVGESFSSALLISSVTVGFGFILHELGHKFMAQKFGHFAVYKSFSWGLVLALVSGLIGFIFAAPGAVYILGAVSTRENGIISMIGPVINLVLALFFLALSYVIGTFFTGSNFLYSLVLYGFSINSWLAFFNLLPIFPLDGSKVMTWSFKTWLVLIVFSGFLSFYV